MDAQGVDLDASIRFIRQSAVADEPAAAAGLELESVVPVPIEAIPAEHQSPAAVDSRGRELYERLQHAEREARRLEEQLETAKSEHQAALTTAAIEADAIDSHVETLIALERRVATYTTELAAQRHRAVLIGNALLPHRQQARSRLETSIREQIADSDREAQAVAAKIAAHYEEIAALERDAQAIEDRARPLARELLEAGLHTSRAVKVTVPFASPWAPPVGVLVKPSVWRAFVEASQAAKLEAAEIVVNELTGQIVRSPIKEAIRDRAEK